MLEIVIQEVLWSIRGPYLSIWNNPLTNVTYKWHSEPWATLASQPTRLSTNFMTLIPSLTFTELWVVSMEHLQHMWLASRERLPFLGSVPLFGTCLCSNCWDQIPRTCHVFTRIFTLITSWYFLDFVLQRLYVILACTGCCLGVFVIRLRNISSLFSLRRLTLDWPRYWLI